jgi:hypothetical protein
MAVTITRSVWIDDDGTGTTGTVINQALHTTLYNEIDTALAKVAQLAGGNTFTGNQSVAGTFQVTTSSASRLLVLSTGEVVINAATNPAAFNAQLHLSVDATHANMLSLQNLGAGVCNFVLFANSAGALAGFINQASATTVSYNTSSDARLKRDEGRASDLSALRAVVVHDFQWNGDGVRARGVFAQEAYAVFPSAITKGTDECTDCGALARPWMTDYSKFVPDLIAGWQQHDADLTELRAILAAAKG